MNLKDDLLTHFLLDIMWN